MNPKIYRIKSNHWNPVGGFWIQVPELRHGLLSHKACLTSHLRPVKPEEQTHLYKPPVRFSQRPLFKQGFEMQTSKVNSQKFPLKPSLSGNIFKVRSI